MAWFADLAGKAETLLNNLDEQTGVALRNNAPRGRTERPHTSPTRSRATSPRTQRGPIKKLPVVETKRARSPRRVLLTSKQCDKDSKKETYPRTWKAPLPKPFTLDNCPETLVGDVIDNNYSGLRQRRLSLPTSKEMVHQTFQCKVQHVEVENMMLKNELGILHKEMSQLLHKLVKTEDGNDVVRDTELTKAAAKLEITERNIQKDPTDQLSLSTQFEELKLKVHELTITEMEKQKQHCREMEMEIDLLKKRNKELEEIGREFSNDATEYKNHKIKADKELKHAQTVISELEGNLEKTTTECRRLERDWEAYKLRVKSMLFAKDKEIKQLQEGLNMTEDTKILIEQIEGLKADREELFEKVNRIRNESSDLQRQVQELETRCAASERVVGAVRDALRDERAAKSRADAKITALSKELETVQTETNETIVSLYAVLREKDNEISRMKEEILHSTDTSALNVADYDDQASINEDKIRYLTHTLVQRQGTIDSLLADNNMLRIQMEKMESKYKGQLSALRAQTQSNHSVVQLQDEVRSRRARPAGSFVRGLSQRVGPMFRYPVFRMFVLFYMLGLHFWVITVLLSTSDMFTRSNEFKESSDNSQPFHT